MRTSFPTGCREGRGARASAPTPRLAFVDLGGHGYATVRVTGEAMRSEFVCIPRPVKRSERPDGGPLRYRVAHTAKLWRPGERPRMVQKLLEGHIVVGVGRQGQRGEGCKISALSR